ncbi:DUF2169 domain-containing protein [Agarilytica rhodophyticola]|uniref:DUF2169 domain-containing protein n=1 Tax=Agarilytica rhodophyticola TaxID=1737490 RepID=UPI000B34608E|nr:DUF2169 domain-containing protein [Agarilytica rhodophyticola]
MEFNNYTPFPGNAWETVNNRNKWSATCMVRVKFKLIMAEENNDGNVKSNEGTKWRLQLDKEQGELFSEDQFFSDEVDSSVRYESDYVNHKAHTDIIVNASSYAPQNMMTNNWGSAVSVYAADGKTLLNRQSLMIKASRYFNDVSTQVSLPIRYEYCTGGVKKIHNKGKANEVYELDLYNPVGCGRYPHKHQQHIPDVRIDYQHEPYKHIPAGFGFIHRSWKSRLDYAGTYDDNWLEKQHPLPPHDFDFHHNQGAHPALIMRGYLQAGAKVSLSNLIKNSPESYFEIPNFRFLARVFSNTYTQHQVMNLDTLIVDIDGLDGEQLCVYASWRSYTQLMDSAIKAEAMLIPEQEKKQGRE